MNKKFTDNELRAYSKNRFEERTLRRRLEKLQDEVVIYHDASAKKRIDLIEESKGIRKTSGGSPVPFALSDHDEDFVVSQRLRRPWAYSVMETTYNNMYREAELPLPRKRGRARAKSAATILIGNASSVNIQKDRLKSDRLDVSKIPRVTQSAKHFNKLHFVLEPERYEAGIDDAQKQSKTVENSKRLDSATSDCVNTESSQNLSQLQVDVMQIPCLNEEISEKEEIFEKSNTWIKDNDIDMRPYAKVLKLPPAYTIDSKSYQDAERERLISRSRSRAEFSSATITTAANVKDQNHIKNKQDSPPEKAEISVAIDNPPQEHDSSLNRDDEFCGAEERGKNVLKVKDNIIFKGHVIRNYIRPEDRYKLDPSVLNRHQHRMDKLAKESSTFLKRINHENIKVEIAFPRSARKRLLTKLIRENNSGRKKTFSNNDGPIIQTKIERFMISISDYIEKQRMERANSFIY